MTHVAMTPQQRSLSSRSPWDLYRDFTVGEHSSLWTSFLYEAYCVGAMQLPGGLGYVLRPKLLSLLLGSSGKKALLGKGLVVRRPAQIHLGDHLSIEDDVALDVRGNAGSLIIGKHCLIGRHTILVAKNGVIELGDGVNVSSSCRIATESIITVGASTLIAAYCYIGPGNHLPATESASLIEQEMEKKGGVTIGSHCWIGSHSTILDGVTIGDGAIIGAHSLVRENVAARSVVAGVPARLIRPL